MLRKTFLATALVLVAGSAHATNNNDSAQADASAQASAASTAQASANTTATANPVATANPTAIAAPVVSGLGGAGGIGGAGGDGHGGSAQVDDSSKVKTLGVVVSPAATPISYGHSTGEGVAPESQTYYLPGLGAIYSEQVNALTVAGIRDLATLYVQAGFEVRQATIMALCASRIGERGLEVANAICEAPAK